MPISRPAPVTTLKSGGTDVFLWPQDDAIARGARDRDKRGFRLLQRIDGIWLDRERLEMSADKARRYLAKHRAGRDRRQAERVNADVGVRAATSVADESIISTGPLVCPV